MPIGSLITLTNGRISLSYGQSHLISLGSLSHPIGETWVEVAYNKQGIPVQQKQLYEPKVTISLEIRLTFDELCELELFYYLHKKKTRQRRIPWVQLIDRRIPFVETGSRTRAIAPGTTELSSTPRQYYPVYRVGLKWERHDLIGSLDGDPMFAVALTATELEKPSRLPL